MDYSLTLAYISTIFLFLGTPGPVTLLVISSSIKNGFKAGFLTIIGTNLASLILILLSFLIIKGIFSVNDNVLLWLTIFGALYVIYFSITAFMEKITLSHQEVVISKKYFRNGFVIGISNPKDVIFFISFFPLFFNVTNDINSSMFVLTILWIILDYSILTTYALFFSKIVNNSLVNIINKTSSMFLFIIGVYALIKHVSLI